MAGFRRAASGMSLMIWRKSAGSCMLPRRRAKRELHFVYPLNVYRYGESDSVPALSRFLEPIPSAILPHASLSGEQ